MNKEQGLQKNTFETDKHDSRIHYITTKPLTPAELPASLASSTTTRKQLGIGQRAILLQTPHGNVLWDLVAFIDPATVSFVNDHGGIKAIVISHPHFYTTHLEWARIFKCPVYVSSDDAEWLNREDKEGVRKWIKEVQDIDEVGGEAKAIQCGGHFDGSLVLLWEKKLFIADTMMSVPVRCLSSSNIQISLTRSSLGFTKKIVFQELSVIRFNGRIRIVSPHPSQLPRMYLLTFKVIPLPPSKIYDIWKAIKPFDFDTTYGAFPGQNVTRPDLKKQVLESMKIFCRVGGHENAAVYEETL